ncbi:MAG: nitroreductase family protein [Bacteroidales bacterium]
MIKDLLKLNRSYRRFYEHEEISMEVLKELVEFAILSPSPRNLQALKFVLNNQAEVNERIFPTLAWAGYLADWDGPQEGERPSAYITILADKTVSSDFVKDYIQCAAGIVTQSILLGCAEKGIGGCIIASIQRKKLMEILGISDNFEILLVLALGIPKEKVIIAEIPENGSIKYWRDENQVHYVPKRKSEDIIIN